MDGVPGPGVEQGILIVPPAEEVSAASAETLAAPTYTATQPERAHLELFQTEVEELFPLIDQLQSLTDVKEIEPTFVQTTASLQTEPEQPLSPEVIRSRLDQISKQILEHQHSFSTTIEALNDQVLPGLRQSSLTFDSQHDRLNHQIDLATTTYLSARDLHFQEQALRQEFKKLEADHKRTLLMEANKQLHSPLESFDQADDATIEALHKRRSLRADKLGLGHLLHRRQIKQLTGDLSILDSILNQHALIHQSETYPTSSTINHQQQLISAAYPDTIVPIVDKILEKFDQLASELNKQTTLPEIPEIPEHLRESLDADFIDKFFLPHLKKAQEEYTDKRALYPEPVDPEQEQEAIEIVKASLTKHHNNKFSHWDNIDPMISDIGGELADRYQNLPFQLKEAINTFFGNQITTWQPMAENYQVIGQLISAAQKEKRQEVLANAERQLLTRISALASPEIKDELFTNLSLDLTIRQSELTSSQSYLNPLLDNFFQSIDNQVWDNFRQNSAALSIFGPEILTDTHRYLLQGLIDRSLIEPYYHESNQRHIDRLMELRSPEALPVIILHAYANNQRYMYLGLEPQETVFYRHINALTKQDLQSLREQNIPGVLDIVNLVKKSPTSQRLDSQVPDENTFQLVPDPISQQIADALLKLRLHLLENGDQNLDGLIIKSMAASSPESMMNAFYDTLRKRGQLPDSYSKALIRLSRQHDPLLSDWQRDRLTEEKFQLFHQSLTRMLLDINNPEGKNFPYRDHFSDQNLLKVLARQPERVEEILELFSPSAHPVFDSHKRRGTTLHQSGKNL
jgi:hypothetical protein